MSAAISRIVQMILATVFVAALMATHRKPSSEVKRRV